MDRQRLAAVVAVLASVLATGMSIEPKRAVAPVAAKVPGAPAAGTSADTATAQPMLSLEGYQKYLAAVVAAQALQDGRERCLAYPDLPGNEWPEGLVEALCNLAPAQPTLDEIERILQQPDGGAELDRRYAARLDAHYHDPSQRDLIFRTYDVWDKSARAERLSNQWVSLAPDSAYAHAARGWQLVEQGWAARGTKFARETPPDNMRRMEALFARAIPDLDIAWKKNKQLLPVCDRLIGIGAASSSGLERVGSDLCFKADPTSYRVLGSLIWAAQPKWGGSLERMRHLVAVARAHEKDNPALAALRVAEASYVIKNDKSSPEWWLANAPKLADLTRIAPDVPGMQQAARGLVKMQRYWDAMVYASQAIRFDPENHEAFVDRTAALTRLGLNDLALVDAKRSIELEPSDGWSNYQMGIVLRNLGRHDESRSYFRTAMNETDTREFANELLCESYNYAPGRPGMAECTAAMLVDYAGSGEAWRLRAIALYSQGTAEAYDAIDQFLARADAKRWSHHPSAVTWFRDFLAKHPRPTTTAAAPGASTK